MMAVLYLLILLVSGISAEANPQLLNISEQNNCIRDIVREFIHQDNCQKISEEIKSKLALKMTNCLLKQLGKPEVGCSKISQCSIGGDSWTTFTTFFSQIDNLCHFYWEVQKAERTQQMVDALMNSAQFTQKTLNKNAQNTENILKLQQALKYQIVSSIATQEQMNSLINNSSLKIAQLAQTVESSLSKIQTELDTQYSSIIRVLTAIDDGIQHLNSLQYFIHAEVTSVSGILYFLTVTLVLILGSSFSKRVKERRNECLIIIGVNFLLEFLFSSIIEMLIDTKMLRYGVFLVIVFIISVTKVEDSKLQQHLSRHLNTARMKRIVRKALVEINDE